MKDSDSSSVPNEAQQSAARFTPRELKVLKLMCDGLTKKEIASDLGMSPKTLDSYRYAIFAKAGVHNGIQLLRWALKSGIISI